MEKALKITNLMMKVERELIGFADMYTTVVNGLHANVMDRAIELMPTIVSDIKEAYDITIIQRGDRVFFESGYYSETLIKDNRTLVANYPTIHVNIKEYQFDLSNSIDMASYLQEVVIGGYTVIDFMDTGGATEFEQAITGLEEVINAIPIIRIELRQIVKIMKSLIVLANK